MVSAETLIGTAFGGVVGWLSRLLFYEYRKRDERQTEEENERVQWLRSTIQIANRVRDAKSEWEKRPVPKLERDQRLMESIADTLSSHRVDGEHIDMDEEFLQKVDLLEERCRETTYKNVSFASVGISEEMSSADESAAKVIQAAKERLLLP